MFRFGRFVPPALAGIVTMLLMVSPVAAAAPYHNVSIQNGHVLIASMELGDARNTALTIIGNEGMQVGAGGSYTYSIAYVDGIQNYCDSATSERIIRYVNGGSFNLPASAVQVTGSATTGQIHADLPGVFISEFRFHYPGSGCTGLDPSLTTWFGAATVTLDLQFSSSDHAVPAQRSHDAYVGPGQALVVSLSSFRQTPAALSGTLHASEPSWDLGDMSGATGNIFIGAGGTTQIAVLH